MDRIERIDRALKYKGSMLEIYEDSIAIPGGKVAKWDFIEHKGAAAVLPVTEEGKIILVRQYRNSMDRETLEIPAGGLEPGEATVKAAARELEEEAGYTSDNLTLLISVATAVAFCNEVIDVYLATDLKKTEQHLDDEEFIDVEMYYPDEIAKMIYQGKIQDSKTIAAVMSYINKTANKDSNK